MSWLKGIRQTRKEIPKMNNDYSNFSEPVLIGKWKNNMPNQFPKTSEIGLRLSDNKKHEVKIIN